MQGVRLMIELQFISGLIMVFALWTVLAERAERELTKQEKADRQRQRTDR